MHQIDTRFRECSGKAVTIFNATLPPSDSDLARQLTKDPYIFMSAVDNLLAHAETNRIWGWVTLTASIWEFSRKWAGLLPGAGERRARDSAREPRTLS